jgi:hypothetical protein
VPVPVFVTATVCADGFPPPAVAVNVLLLGVKVIVGACVIVNETLMFCGLLVTPLADDDTGTVAV